MKLAAGKCRANRKRWLSTLCRYRLWSIVPWVVWMSGVYMSRTDKVQQDKYWDENV